MKVDFSQAKSKHFQWQIKIRNFLNGQELLTEQQAVSHKYCDLGKWYYAEGQALYGHLDVMKNFEIEHEHLHNLIKLIRELKMNGKSWEAEAKFNELQRTSRNIISLLTTAEKEINAN